MNRKAACFCYLLVIVFYVYDPPCQHMALFTLSFESKAWVHFVIEFMMLGWCLWMGHCFFFNSSDLIYREIRGEQVTCIQEAWMVSWSFTTWYSVSLGHAADVLQTSKFRVSVIHVKKQLCLQTAACLKWQHSWDKTLAFCPTALWVHLEVRSLNESLLFTCSSVPPAALSPFHLKKSVMHSELVLSDLSKEKPLKPTLNWANFSSRT